MAARDGDEAAAQRWVEIALERDPVNPEAYEQAGEVLRAIGQDEQAAALEQEAEDLLERYGK